VKELKRFRKGIGYLTKKHKKDKGVFPADLLELDLGIDSLGRIELASELENLFGIKIKDEIIGNAFTVRDLILGVELLFQEGVRKVSATNGPVAPGPDYWKKILQVVPTKENLDKIDLAPRFAAWLIGSIVLAMTCMYFKIFYNIKVEGRENVPDAGPYILFANHASYYDGFIIGVVISRTRWQSRQDCTVRFFYPFRGGVKELLLCSFEW